MSKSKKTLIKLLGVIMIILGLVGLLLPFLQGILFLIIGIALLSVTSPQFKSKIDKFLDKHPKTKIHFNNHHERLHKYFHKQSADE